MQNHSVTVIVTVKELQWQSYHHRYKVTQFTEAGVILLLRDMKTSL